MVEAMAAKLVQPPIPAVHVALAKARATEMMRIHRRAVESTNQRKKTAGSGQNPYGLKPIFSIRAAGQTSGAIGEDKKIEEDVEEEERPSDSVSPVAHIKAQLYQAVQGINRGIFGVPSEKKSEIEYLAKLLESQNPTPDPAQNLDKVDGSWKLVYSTITILGPKRTKLGLRDFITLGDFFQTIYTSEGKAVNVIKFDVRGLHLLNGRLTIEASFKIASKSRVDIVYENSTIIPEQLMNMFRKNYDLLLGIFNPEGWLEISYVDENMRIGRDDKGNIFILERAEDKYE